MKAKVRSHISPSAVCNSIDLFAVHLYTMFAHAEPEMQVCQCNQVWAARFVWLVLLAASTPLFLWEKGTGCLVQIKVCRYFWAVPLRQTLSADSPVGCVSRALGNINTPLMSPFLEESGKQSAGMGWGCVGVRAESVLSLVPQLPYGFPRMLKQKGETQLRSH